ncbi:TPA: stable inheritance protein KleA [Klebsiella variicola subsp. variicola]|nr:stable inheritance protein KleA [Klebsiella variicola subsp. variicola]HCI4627467.1 stable inheritance protein KleA [Klebsiella variicola subsp. variicola]HCI6660950.1 stable inheritance protein KleA [Klebsiella variicola subsp. variicola]
MKKADVMSWVDALPGVKQTNLQERRDNVAELMARADELLQQAQELRSQAYFESLSIESAARSTWTNEIVDTVKAR